MTDQISKYLPVDDQWYPIGEVMAVSGHSREWVMEQVFTFNRYEYAGPIDAIRRPEEKP